MESEIFAAEVIPIRNLHVPRIVPSTVRVRDNVGPEGPDQS